MIKIPSSTNKVKKRGRERGGEGERRLSLALSLLCGTQSQQPQKQRWAANLGFSEDVDTSPWLCHHLSWHVSSPACVSLSILTRHRKREREQARRDRLVHRPPLYVTSPPPPPLCPSLPLCFPIFKSLSRPITEPLGGGVGGRLCASMSLQSNVSYWHFMHVWMSTCPCSYAHLHANACMYTC